MEKEKEFQHYVLGFLFSKDMSEVVLLEKNKPDFLAGKINGVGGKLDPEDVSVNEAMSREFEEETGLVIEPGKWISIGRIMDNHFEVDVFYSLSDNVHDARTVEEEVVMTISVEEARKHPRLMPNLPEMFDMAINHNRFNG